MNNTSIEKVSQDIERAIKECGVQAIAALPKFTQAIKMANGIAAMRAALTDQFVNSTLIPLQGTALGFLTDKDSNGGYGVAVVRECSIEAMIRGFNVVGNEFNIISGRFYGTKNGFERLVSEFPGLTHLVLQPGVPHLVADKGALVPYTAAWRLNGAPMSLECIVKEGADLRIPVKVNAGMGPDAIIGKATRKILARIYQRVHGSSFGVSDGEVGEEPIVTTGEPAPSPVPAGAVEGRRYSLKDKKQPNGAPAPAKDAVEATPPPPSASPAGAPADLVDRARLLQMLREIDPVWDAPDFDAQSTIEAWTEKECHQAQTWASGYLGNVARNIPRPQHTNIIMRQPGED